MATPEPKIVVPRWEYERELAELQDKARRREKLYREWGRAASLYRWYRRPEDVERIRRVIAEIVKVRREEVQERRRLARKVVLPYWRIEVAYQFKEERARPPYYFYLECRKIVFTRNPELYAKWNPLEMAYTDPLPWLEGELRLVLFASSLISRVTKRGWLAHVEWLEALLKRKVFPFPNFECKAIDESELVYVRPDGAAMPASLDRQYYYFRVTDLKKDYEYDNWNRYVNGKLDTRGVGVLYWLRSYETWLRSRAREGKITYPEAYTRTVKQTSIEDFVRKAKEYRERLKIGGEKPSE
jgi:disulfide oxidoreductase YuzD